MLGDFFAFIGWVDEGKKGERRESDSVFFGLSV